MSNKGPGGVQVGGVARMGGVEEVGVGGGC